jgi:bifunctional non-homologous end joining protein LigD
VDRIPEGDLWQYELKLDGYRTIAVKQDCNVALFSRNGNPLNEKFPSVAASIRKLPFKYCILDGEMVGLDEQGRHSFGSLQNITTSKAPLRFYVFDLLNINGEDLTKSTLQKRRERLEEGFTSQVELSPILPGDARTVLAHVKELNSKVSSQSDWISIYVPGKTSDAWQKHKTQASDDFLVGGYMRSARY